METDLYNNKEQLTSQDEQRNVKLWHERIGIAKKAKENWADESGAKRFIQEYNGKFDIFFNGLKGKIPIPPINEVFAYVQADIAATYNRDPYITVNPKAGTVIGAKLREIRLNYWWRELKIKEEIEIEIIDKDLVGSAWHKVGYAVNSIGTGEKLKIENEKLYSMRVDWNDVFWNLNAKRPPKDCQWMAQRIVRPLTDIKKYFPNAKHLEGSPSPDVDKKSYESALYKDDIKVGIFYEIWDAETRKIYLIADGLEDKYLSEPKDWVDYIDEFPFQIYWDYWKPGSAYPMSAIAPWEPQILEEMVLLAQAINHSKRWNRQAFVKSGTIDENSLDKFERGDDGAVIVYNGESADIQFADFGTFPQDFFTLMDRLQAIKRNINGQPEFNRGGMTKTGTRTIGELQLMQQGSKGLTDRKIDRLETHLENIARHMDSHLQANFDFEETVKVTGEPPEEVLEAVKDFYDPVTKTVTYSADDIKGEYDIDIKAGSTLPLDKQTRVQVFETILQTVATVTSQGPMSPFLNALIQEILRDYDIKSLQEAYELEVQQAQEAQQQQQEQQSVDDQKTLAETAKREAQAAQVQADTEITTQDAMLGPVGRAQVKSLEKPPQVNGDKK